MTTKLRRRYEAARRNGKSERGAALVVAMFLLLLMSFVGIYALDTVALDRQVAGFQNRKRIAFYAAEAAVAEALDSLETTGTPSVGGGNMGDTTLYPYGTPSYAVDPTVANPIAPIGAGMRFRSTTTAATAATTNTTVWRTSLKMTLRTPPASV